MATSDQIEVLKNRQAVLRNIAAVHLATGHFGAAIECCTEAIEISSGKDVKGLLRRARAYTFRHEYEVQAMHFLPEPLCC